MSADLQAKTIKPMGIQGGIDAKDVLGAMGAMLGAAGLGVIWCVSIHSFPPNRPLPSIRRCRQGQRTHNFRALF